MGVKRRHVAVLLAAVALVTAALKLDSETLTLTTSYPAPSGVYNTMVTRGQTSLARDGGDVGIGIGNPQAQLHMVSQNALLGDLRIWPDTAYADIAFDGGSDNAFLFRNMGAPTGWTGLSNQAGSLLSVVYNTGDSYLAGNLNANDVYLRDIGRWASQASLLTTTVWNTGVFYPGGSAVIAVYASCPGGYLATGGACYDPYHIFVNYTDPSSQTHYCYYFQLACPTCWSAQVMCARVQ